MKRVLFLLLVLGIFSIAAGPALEGQNRLKFTLENQAYTGQFSISSISWVSASGDEIGATGGFILEETNGDDIASCEATAVSDQCQFTFPEPVIVNGIVADWITGDVYVYGKRR